ncbi:hypothetical protein OC834_003314 [Tilletia horrida]|nr:hypothetical protein OC834_003314 [Tilletia horrida]KAK0535228.1 hypothetical protein OC835_002422 [Tilletia horrida]KAK0563588.1 hypothetical protein OC844_002134 [Tilletia horrida]
MKLILPSTLVLTIAIFGLSAMAAPHTEAPEALVARDYYGCMTGCTEYGGRTNQECQDCCLTPDPTKSCHQG